MPKIEVPREQLAAYCRRHRVRKLAFFGSVRREDVGPGSDVDVLVEFEDDARVGLISLAAMELELGELLGCNVDLRTPADLKPVLPRQSSADRRNPLCRLTIRCGCVTCSTPPAWPLASRASISAPISKPTSSRPMGWSG